MYETHFDQKSSIARCSCHAAEHTCKTGQRRSLLDFLYARHNPPSTMLNHQWNASGNANEVCKRAGCQFDDLRVIVHEKIDADRYESLKVDNGIKGKRDNKCVDA